jgi:hypothetical protein
VSPTSNFGAIFPLLDQFFGGANTNPRPLQWVHAGAFFGITGNNLTMFSGIFFLPWQTGHCLLIFSGLAMIPPM